MAAGLAATPAPPPVVAPAPLSIRPDLAYYLFAAGATPAPPPPVVAPQLLPGAEARIMDDVVARLAATGAFGEAGGPAEVAWGARMEALFPEAATPSAAVEYLGSTEATIADYDFLVRDGRYSVTLAARSPDARDRGTSLSQLAAIARNALSNVSLAGMTQPYFSRLKEDASTAASLPEGRAVLTGSFRYTIDDDSSRDESDDF